MSDSESDDNEARDPDKPRRTPVRQPTTVYGGKSISSKKTLKKTKRKSKKRSTKEVSEDQKIRDAVSNLPGNTRTRRDRRSAIVPYVVQGGASKGLSY